MSRKARPEHEQSAVLPRSDITADAVLRRLRVHEPPSLAAVGEAAVAIECETEMRSQRSDGRVLLRIGIGIGCGNDDDPEPAAVLATRRQHRRTQRIALPVAQREEKRHLSLYMGLEADVALDRVGPLRTPWTAFSRSRRKYFSTAWPDYHPVWPLGDPETSLTDRRQQDRSQCGLGSGNPAIGTERTRFD